MPKQPISTSAAPAAIGPYSQAVRVGDTVWLSGQIPLDPATMRVVDGPFENQARQVFTNLAAVIGAAGARSDDVVKVNVYVVDLANFDIVNTVMSEFFDEPYPARAAVEVSALPKGALIEVEAILVAAPQ